MKASAKDLLELRKLLREMKDRELHRYASPP
jgi:hypothetical protein